MVTITKKAGDWTHGLIIKGSKKYEFGAQEVNGELHRITILKPQKYSWPFAGISITVKGSKHLNKELLEIYEEIKGALNGQQTYKRNH